MIDVEQKFKDLFCPHASSVSEAKEEVKDKDVIMLATGRLFALRETFDEYEEYTLNMTLKEEDADFLFKGNVYSLRFFKMIHDNFIQSDILRLGVENEALIIQLGNYEIILARKIPRYYIGTDHIRYKNGDKIYFKDGVVRNPFGKYEYVLYKQDKVFKKAKKMGSVLAI